MRNRAPADWVCTGRCLRAWLMQLGYALSDLHDNLRVSQLKGVLDDVSNYRSRLPALVAGDLNFDIAGGQASVLIEQAGMPNLLG